MKKLLILDEKDYTSGMPVFEKYAARAIIRKGERIAVQISKDGEYKIPGGTVEAGESYEQACIREVREETGLLVKLGTVKTNRIEQEIQLGYALKWDTVRQIYDSNIRLQKDPWTMRDTAFLKLILDQAVEL